MSNESKILALSFKDLFTSKILLFSVMPFIITVLTLYILFFILAGIGVEQLNHMILDVNTSQTVVTNGVAHTESFSAQLANTAIIKFLLHNSVTAWLATFLIYTIGSLAVLFLSIFIALLIIGLMTHWILKELQQRHYQDVAMIGFSNFFVAILLAIKWFVIMLLLYIILIPLYFIPIIDIVAFNFPLYFFFHKMLIFDVSSTICTKEEANTIKYRYGNTLRLKTLALYLISLIPFMIFFASVFYVIYLGHSYFLEVREMRKNTL